MASRILYLFQPVCVPVTFAMAALQAFATLQAFASLIRTLFVPVQSGSLIIVLPFHPCQDVAHCKDGDSVD